MKDNAARAFARGLPNISKLVDSLTLQLDKSPRKAPYCASNSLRGLVFYAMVRHDTVCVPPILCSQSRSATLCLVPANPTYIMTNDRLKYSGIPEDFPVAPISYALAGAQPKLNLVEEEGKYYSPGTSPSEVSDAFEVCEDLAQQFVKYCLEKETAKFGTRAEILERVRQRLLEKDWCTPAQCGWIARRTASLLAWQMPDE